MTNTLRKTFLFLFLVLFPVLLPQASWAVPTSHVAAAQAQERPRALLPIAELGQQIQALVTGNDNAEIEPQETFGTRALGVILTFFEVVRQDGSAFVTNFAALPQFMAWFNQQITDPAAYDRWLQIGQRLLLVLGAAFVVGWLVDLLLVFFRRQVRRQRPATMAARFGALLSWLFLSLVPIIAFLGTALALMDQGQQVKVVRYVVMTVVYGFAVLRLLLLAIRFLLAPRSPGLRLLPLSDHQAVYAQRWLNAFGIVMVIGFFVVDIARLVRVPPEVIASFNDIVGLVVVTMAVAVVIQKRAFVSSFLRGDLSAARHGLSLWQTMRLGLARSWHILAIAYLVVGYIVTMLQAGGGFAIMQRGTILTLLALFGMRLGMYVVARIQSRHHAHGRDVTSGMFLPVLRVLLKLAIWAVGIGCVAAAWGADVEGMMLSPWGQRILGSVFTITATLVIVVLIYEYLHTVVERKLHQKDAEGHELEANGRARTLLPMLRNAAMVVLAVIVGMVTLSELGINIAPLLAGAGVIGVALGFGSQTLVKDFLTGLFIILENAIAVGDVVTIGDLSGVVESITMRTVRLRDLDGSLHILPFSEITKFTNRTKGFAYALMDLGVAYDSDLTRVIGVVRDEGVAMQQDPAWRAAIMEPIEVLGVDALGDFSITIKCRIKTRAGLQWDVKRAFLLRIKQRFDRENIVIPFPTSVQIRKAESPAG